VCDICVVTDTLQLKLGLRTEHFSFTIEIQDKQKGSRAIEIISSTMTWSRLQQIISQHLNIYPTSLHAQYRLSTDNKKDLPCDLTSQRHLDTLHALLRPLIVPAVLANGRRSVRQKKPVTIQIFDKNSEILHPSSENKVSETIYCSYQHSNKCL
jgi:hypothetical protein